MEWHFLILPMHLLFPTVYIYICIYGADFWMAVLADIAAYRCIIILLLDMYGWYQVVQQLICF